MQEEWDVYLKEEGGTVVSTTVNLALRVDAPRVDRPHVLRVRVFLRSPGPQGLPRREEFESLNRMEDQLVEVLQGEHLLVGTRTTAGVRELVFYGREAGRWEVGVNGVMERFREYRFEGMAGPDPGWKHYLEVLYPSDEQMESIKNRRVCLSLQQHGDPLTEARPIDHFAYFDDEAARARFVERAATLGFEHQLLAPAPGGSRKFGVQLVRVDVPSFEGIDAITLPLRREVLAHGGDYDGWGCPVPGAKRGARTGERDPAALKALLALFGITLAILAFALLTRK